MLRIIHFDRHLNITISTTHSDCIRTEYVENTLALDAIMSLIAGEVPAIDGISAIRSLYGSHVQLEGFGEIFPNKRASANVDSRANKFRFDDSYNAVYEYSVSASAYLFLCSYLQCGISSKNRELTKFRKIQKWLDASE